MKLFHLKRIGHCGYDEYDSMIVRAEDETHARVIASNNCGDEGGVWTSRKKVTCEVLTPKGESGLVLGSFNAG